jgi:hypothetical protein
MQKLLSLAAVALIALPMLGHAADVPRSDEDCAKLLERWASDPKAAPKWVIDKCKEQLTRAEPPAAAEPPPALAADTDPCSGPGASDSVLCWGPWNSLAPAAAGPDVSRQIAGVDDPETRPELSDAFDPELVPELPLGACAPGTPCGFATIVAGFTSNGDAEDTEFGRFDLAPDGSQFTVSPGGAPPINSVPGMDTTVDPRPDGFENLRANGTVGNQESAVTARVVRDDGGKILLAADVWTHVSSLQPELVAKSGKFAWGTTTSQAGIDALNAGNVSLNFTGPMSVDKTTTGSMTVNLGASPTWTGNWTNPAWSFGAGGVVTGANLISQPGKFSDNVTGSGSFVQGALVGEQGGARGITHIIDVTLADQGRIKDVGLLREILSPAVAP